MRHKRRFHLGISIILTSLAILTGCESIQKAAKSKIPIAKAGDVRIAAADFSSLDLVLDLVIENPNNFGVTLSGLPYDLVINEHSLLQGEQSKSLRIEAAQRSTVAIPVSLVLQNLFTEIPEILQQDTFNYRLDTRPQFTIPLIGNIEVPLTKTGSLPVIRPPKIQDVSLTKRAINLTGADLDLQIALKNPNNFDLTVKELAYTFGSNQQSWSNGTTQNAIALSSNDDGTINIPVHLNFLSLGKTVFQLLTGAQEFRAAIDGNMTLDSSVKYLNQMQLPFHFEKDLSLE